MKKLSVRLGIVTAVLAVTVASVAALAKSPQQIMHRDTTQCSRWLRKNVCTRTCEGSVYTHGSCVDNTTGVETSITFECCCCTAGAENRTFIGG